MTELYASGSTIVTSTNLEAGRIPCRDIDPLRADFSIVESHLCITSLWVFRACHFGATGFPFPSMVGLGP